MRINVDIRELREGQGNGLLRRILLLIEDGELLPEFVSPSGKALADYVDNLHRELVLEPPAEICEAMLEAARSARH